MSDPRGRRDDDLSRLLRAAYPDDSGEFERPDDPTIRAYVDGTATEDQTQIVEEALLLSADFREEIYARLQVERDVARGDLADRMAAVEVPSGLSGIHGESDDDRPGIIATLGAWLWRPQVGYGLALAASLSLVLMRTGPAPRIAGDDVGRIQQFAMSPVLDVRSDVAEADRVHVLPGRSHIDLIPLYSFDEDVVERYRVEASLTGPDGVPLPVSGDELGFVPDGEGGRLLRWRLPVDRIAEGPHTAAFFMFRLGDEDGAPVDSVTIRFIMSRGTP